MKLSEQWLREWVNPPLNVEQLAEQLTMAGLEVDALMPVAKVSSQIVIGQVLSTSPHPNADRLQICQIQVDEDQPLQIVTNDLNVKVGSRVPVAKIGAILSSDLTIKHSKLRGVDSFGMLCGSTEFGITGFEGVWQLPQDAPIGLSLREYMQLDDHILELKVTTNRGDCLSLQGLAREVAVLNGLNYQPHTIKPIPAVTSEKFPVQLVAPDACPQYVGRVITGINLSLPSPLWMVEKLRRSGVRSINAVVDVTNYVMLELGQPLHAFDLDRLKGAIEIRYARAGEKLALLNEQTVELNQKTLVIADQQGPQAMAGVMGGQLSGVSSNTTAIFLESAYFNPLTISDAVQHYHFTSDSAHRFERGVDPELQAIAIERATALILQLVGGQPGPLIQVTDPHYHPTRKPIQLRRSRIKRILGIEIDDAKVTQILQSLGMMVVSKSDGWEITPPSYRFDQHQEADLIEEIARIYGYNNIPTHLPEAKLNINVASENKITLTKIRQLLVDRDYHEAISYSFVPEHLQQKLDPNQVAQKLLNPISPDLAVMRTNLLPGLVQAVLYNQNRQENRIRLFEVGLCFREINQELRQPLMLGGLVSGQVLPEQWGAAARAVDFFDLKADVEAIFALLGLPAYQLAPIDTQHYPQFHPHQAANILYQNQSVGMIGALHPSLIQELEINNNVFIFELNLDLINNGLIPNFKAISKFPAVRRDLAFIFDKTITIASIQEKIVRATSGLLRNIKIFDIYQGNRIDSNKKSVAVGLIFQHTDHTLTDDEVNKEIAHIIKVLEQEFNAKLRE